MKLYFLKLGLLMGCLWVFASLVTSCGDNDNGKPEIDTDTDSDTSSDTHSEIQGDISLKEDYANECDLPNMPKKSELESISKLPNPFTFKIGNSGEVVALEDWKCRREEINAAAQAYIYGEKPIPDTVIGAYSGGVLTVTVEDEGTSISFDVEIQGGDPSNPKPLLLAYTGPVFGGTNIPGIPSSIVTADFNTDDIAVDGKVKMGKFYDLYATNHPAGELVAWAWAVSRIIDALETTPKAGIDATKVAVTGCSRYGKGALAAGALDARIALTIPEEAGSGGGAAWRIIASEKSSGQDIQTLSSACSECEWLHSQFCSWDGSESNLPIDMHEVMGMVAPRGLLFLDGNGGNQWLAVTATYWSAHGTQEIYKALGEEGAFTYSQMDSSHCLTPGGQEKYVKEYMNYYLLGQGHKPAGGIHKISARNFDAASWIDWETPVLQ